MSQEWTILNRYTVIGRLDRGGQAEVYLARDLRLNRKIAIKRSNLRRLSETDRERFLREASILARTRHRYIIPIYSLEEDGDWLYMVTQFADGGNLLDQIAAYQHGLPINEVIDVGIAMCKALEAVHLAGIIHRDVKPGNVLLVTEEGEDKPVPKLSDFGIARDRTAAPLTLVGETPGTPVYMPPEATGVGEDQVDERRDVYALGATLYEALTKTVPLRSLSPLRDWELLLHLREPPVSPRRLRKDVPVWLECIILRALEPNPEERYHTMHEMLADLEQGKRSLETGEAPPAVPVKRRVSWQLIGTGITFSIVFIVALALFFGSRAIVPLRTTPSPTASYTAAVSPSVSFTVAATPSLVPSETPTATATASPTPTFTLTPSPTRTGRPLPSATQTPIPTEKPNHQGGGGGPIHE